MIMKIRKVLGMLEHYAGNEAIAVQAFLDRCYSLLDIAESVTEQVKLRPFASLGAPKLTCFHQLACRALPLDKNLSPPSMRKSCSYVKKMF